jgi:HTH-type transcriptional regulator, competence development regulator
MDLVLKLRELRRLRGLTQKDVARLSGVGQKTISSFETGERIASLKLAQLERILAVYGMTEAEFFGGRIEREIAPWDLDGEELAARRLLDDLHALSKTAQRNLLAKFQLMIETVAEVYGGPEQERFVPEPAVFNRALSRSVNIREEGRRQSVVSINRPIPAIASPSARTATR